MLKLPAIRQAALCVAMTLLAAATVWGQRVAATATDTPAGTTGKGGLHLPQTKQVSFTCMLTDGGGFRWDIQPYGSIGQGTNYAYSGGMYCQIQGNNVQSPRGNGWSNETGDEIEIGPYQRNGLNAWRRIKVYADQPLARWLDIFENTTEQPITVQVQIYSCMNYQQVFRSVSGGATFGEKDWSFITEPQGSGNNTPSLLHIVCDAKSKLRPTMQLQSNQLYVRWNLVVPAKQTAVLCHFESQNNSVDAHQALLKKFRPSAMLKDISASVRKLIVNFSTGGGLDDVVLERSESDDSVLLTNGDPLYGKIVNEAFRLNTIYGPIDLPAAKVIGLVPTSEANGQVRAVLADGQVISGKMDGSDIRLSLSTGGEPLKIPLERVQQCSYRISAARPEDVTFAGPMAVLRTGDRLAFDPAATKLSLRTRHGLVELAGKELKEISLDNAAHAVHRVAFRNGSHLAGFVEPSKIDLVLKIGPKLTVPRDLIVKMVYAEEDEPDETLTQIVLSNEDELFGKLSDATLSITGEFGPVSVKPDVIRALTFDADRPGRVVLELWNGTVVRGLLQQEEIGFTIMPGPAMKVFAGQIRSVVSSQTLPPEDIRKKVEQLAAQLGAESYQDRQTASEALIKMGSAIAPLLKKYLKNEDPEVRQRIEEILDRIGSKASAGGAENPRLMMVD